MRALQYNTHLFGTSILQACRGFHDEARRAAIARAVAALAPDVVSLQEVWGGRACRDLAERLAPTLPWHEAPTAARFLRSGLLLLSRTPLRAPRFEALTDLTPDDWGARKGILSALVDQPQPTLVVTAHLQAHDTEQARSARAKNLQQIVDHVNRRRATDTFSSVVLLGDLNIGDSGAGGEYDTLRETLPAAAGWIDSWREAHTSSHGAPGHTWMGAETHIDRHFYGMKYAGEAARLDHVWVTGRTVLAASIPRDAFRASIPGADDAPIDLSDHLPLLVELSDA